MPSPYQTALVQRLFVQNMVAVRGFVISLMPDFARVDDVVQETFLTVTDKADDFEEGTNFRSWVFSIARFKVLEAARAPGAKEVMLDPEVIEALCTTEGEDFDPGRELQLLAQCEEGLARKAKQVIKLRYESACSPPEIAETMGWTVNAVNVALARARKALRECLDRKLKTQKN
ncbi:MAG: sigma-70 family RNA polymerase sigma factor [Verrucomicrobiota bacterium]